VASQPDWRDAETFVASYHPIQLVPYAFGFLLIIGCVTTVVAFARQVPRHSNRGILALICTSVFASLIVLNYTIQTTFVPGLAADYKPALAPVLEALTMRNPRSLAWALEMWGYAIVGVGMWIVTPGLRGTRLERTTRWLFLLNLVMSLAGGLATAYRIDWVFTSTGLVSFGLWNALMLVLAGLVTLVWQRRWARADI
jgi:hypothetical protein